MKEEFYIGKLLGKGNSAKVHRCERKNSTNSVKHYALKTIQKSFIKSNPRNIVSFHLNSFSLNLLLELNSSGDRLDEMHVTFERDLIV